MVRPQSIVAFERSYLGYLALGALNLALHWSIYAGLPSVRRSAELFGEWYYPTATALSFAVPLLLWFFAARRASRIAKWAIVVFFVFNLLGLSASLVLGTPPSGAAVLLSVAASALYGVAVWMLFKPHSRAWFGEA